MNGPLEKEKGNGPLSALPLSARRGEFRSVFRFEDDGGSPQSKQEEIAANDSPTVSHPSWTEKKWKTRDAGNYKHDNEAKKRKVQIHQFKKRRKN